MRSGACVGERVWEGEGLGGGVRKCGKAGRGWKVGFICPRRVARASFEVN